MWLEKFRKNYLKQFRKIEMMYVVVTPTNFIVYGPFANYNAAAKWRDSMEKRYSDIGFFIKRITSPATM